MRHPLAVGLAFALCTAIPGCQLEFVDAEIHRPARFNLVVHADSEADSIYIDGTLDRGYETGQRNVVLSGLQIEGRLVPPQVMGETEWRWNASLPASIVAGGHLTVQPPVLQYIEVPLPMVAAILVHNGSSEISLSAGEPIELRFDFAPLPRQTNWRVRLSDADGAWLYQATSQTLPPGQIVIPAEMIPATAPGPYRADLEIGAFQPDETEGDNYEVNLLTRGLLTWVIRRE